MDLEGQAAGRRAEDGGAQLEAGFYVLQINTYAAPEYRPILDRMVAAIDKDARIYPP